MSNEIDKEINKLVEGCSNTVKKLKIDLQLKRNELLEYVEKSKQENFSNVLEDYFYMVGTLHLALTQIMIHQEDKKDNTLSNKVDEALKDNSPHKKEMGVKVVPESHENPQYSELIHSDEDNNNKECWCKDHPDYVNEECPCQEKEDGIL